MAFGALGTALKTAANKTSPLKQAATSAVQQSTAQWAPSALADRIQQNAAPQPLTTAPSGYDQSGPGVGEQFFNATQGQYGASPAADFNATAQPQLAQPGAASQHWEGVQGQFSGPAPDVTNNTQSAYDAYMRNTPEIAALPGLEPYYDNARTTYVEDTNRQLAARGAFNSSAALDSIGSGLASLNAEQANREADYGLARAAEQRQWYGLGGDLASLADNASLNEGTFGLDWLKTGGDLAGAAGQEDLDRIELGGNLASDADRAELDRLIAGQTSAFGAQLARDTRVQAAFDNMLRVGEGMATVAGDAYTQMFAADSALMDAVLSGDVASVAEALNISRDTAGRIMDDLTAIAGAVTEGVKATNGATE